MKLCSCDVGNHNTQDYHYNKPLEYLTKLRMEIGFESSGIFSIVFEVHPSFSR
jgi:hypothetical protein